MYERIKESAIAGSWYPGDPKDLRDLLQGFLRNADNGPDKRVRAVISPHAGYMYSGRVAAHGYHRIDRTVVNRVILMAPSHHFPLFGASVGDYTHFRTPLGKVPVSERAALLVKQCPVVSAREEPFEEEHALEIQLPFLQMILGDFSLIPLVLGRMNEDQMRILASSLLEHADETTLMVISTDLSHFHSYDEAVYKDRECIKSILAMDREKASEQEMCGIIPVLTFLLVAMDKRWSPELLKYANSGDVTGDRSSVVGYASIIFREVS